jgi:hypothetical protein
VAPGRDDSKRGHGAALEQGKRVYRWYDRYRTFGLERLKDSNSGPGRVWNRIPDEMREMLNARIAESRRPLIDVVVLDLTPGKS